jgi:predicted nucleotidyltransferase
MDRQTVIDRLSARQGELRALGITRLALFGSTARGEAGPDSDVDLAAELDDAAAIDLFRYADISERIADMLGTRVDLVSEPSRSPRLQAEIDRDRVRVF